MKVKLLISKNDEKSCTHENGVWCDGEWYNVIDDPIIKKSIRWRFDHILFSRYLMEFFSFSSPDIKKLKIIRYWIMLRLF